jgi:hypothetical protein
LKDGPCNQSAPGPLTYTSQLRRQTIQGNEKSTPQQTFWNDLTTFIQEKTTSIDYIILGSDTNGDINNPTSYPRKMLCHTQLQDTLHQYNPHQVTIPTYINGSKRIDGIFTSSTLNSHLVNYTQLPYEYILASDHRGLIMDIINPLIDITQKNKQPTIISPRILNHHQANKVKSYIKTVTQQFENFNIQQRLILPATLAKCYATHNYKIPYTNIILIKSQYQHTSTAQKELMASLHHLL